MWPYLTCNLLFIDIYTFNAIHRHLAIKSNLDNLSNYIIYLISQRGRRIFSSSVCLVNEVVWNQIAIQKPEGRHQPQQLPAHGDRGHLGPGADLRQHRGAALHSHWSENFNRGPETRQLQTFRNLWKRKHSIFRGHGQSAPPGEILQPKIPMRLQAVLVPVWCSTLLPEDGDEEGLLPVHSAGGGELPVPGGEVPHPVRGGGRGHGGEDQQGEHSGQTCKRCWTMFHNILQCCIIPREGAY